MSRPTDSPSATLTTLPTELLVQIALRVHSVDDLLSLVHTTHTFRAVLWTPLFRHAWYTAHFPATGEWEDATASSSAPDKSFLRSTASCYRAAATLGQVPLDLATYFKRDPSIAKAIPNSTSSISETMWDVALPWSLRAHIITTAPTRLASVRHYFHAVTNQELGDARFAHQADIRLVGYAWLNYRFDEPWAERFCRIAFRGALQQRRALRTTHALHGAAAVDPDAESNDFMALQRDVQAAIITTSDMVNGELVKDTVTFYGS
ncbi:hypothetical protein DFJ77DRAFT_89592 [Powellomyces hirtus]|nr:hypothetical protein DFJ77DRAFT_89592 [Powellomyces hirtus]